MVKHVMLAVRVNMGGLGLGLNRARVRARDGSQGWRGVRFRASLS